MIEPFESGVLLLWPTMGRLLILFKGSINDQGCCGKMRYLATKFVRENAFAKARPNMTLASFTKFINLCLPNYSLKPGYPRNVSIETGRRWLHHLGFSVVDAKKGTYVDGHEREDVVLYRQRFLRKMVCLGFLTRENAPTEEAVSSLPDDLESPSPDVLNKIRKPLATFPFTFEFAYAFVRTYVRLKSPPTTPPTLHDHVRVRRVWRLWWHKAYLQPYWTRDSSSL